MGLTDIKKELKKLGTSKELIADLMLFYVETGVEFTNEFGDIDEQFYNSVASVYSQQVVRECKIQKIRY